MRSPLISVMMPCFNGAETLPWALASLLAQSYENWECIVVDDGSTDGSADLVAAIVDERVRLHRLPQNRGRPYARQVALDAARGAFLAMLDADDWLYPCKLASQAELLTEQPSLAAVGSAVMIVDSSGMPQGTQGCANTAMSVVHRRVSRIDDLRLAHAPTLLRRHAAKGFGYNPALARGEDQDFLVRVLLGRRYALLNRPLYAYREADTMTYEKVRVGLSCGAHRFRSYRALDPWSSARGWSKTQGKRAVYWLASQAGLFPKLISRRSRPATESELREHAVARSTVWSMLSGLVAAGIMPSNSTGH